MRILVVEPSIDESGATRVALDRSARWQAMGAAVTHFVVHAPHARERVAAVPGGLAVRFGTPPPADAPGSPATRVVRALRGRSDRALALGRLARLAAQADVVVSGREIGRGLHFAALATRLTRRPLAVTVQSNVDAALAHYVPPAWQQRTRRALARADLLVCVAQGIVPGLEALGVRPGRIHVQTNGVDVPLLRAQAALEPPIALPAVPFVAAMGWLARVKGFDVLIEAHARALASGAPDHALVVLGEGRDRDRLLEQARALGVGGSVRLPGFVANPHAVLARAHLFALPSRWEGFPLALVEALALGVPMVASDCVSGPREVLGGGAYGRLVTPEDADVLAAALAEHLRDPSGLRGRAHAGAQGAAERFDPERAARRHLELLTRLAEGAFTLRREPAGASR